MTTAPIIPPPFREVEPDGTLRLNFHPGQTRAWESEARFVYMISGTQGGKTCFAPHWMHREITSRGPGDYIAVTATFPLLKLKMLPEYLYVFDSLLKLGVWREADKVFTSHDTYHGSPAWRLVFGSATNPESIESATALAAHMDECGQVQFKRQSYEAILRRLSLAQGRILGTTTPYIMGWLKHEVVDRWRAGDPDYDVIQGSSLWNPAFPREEYERAQLSLPPWKFQMFYEGQFERPAGSIYDCFDDGNITKRFDIPSAWPRFVGHDFGPNNTAAVWFAHDPATGYLYVYRTYHAGGLSAFDHAQEFKAASFGETILKRVGGSQVEEGWREAFRSAGWPIVAPRKDRAEVEVGINAVYGWVKAKKLFVFSDLDEYLDEITSYSRELDEAYDPTEKIADKSRYHLMDCTRYMLGDFRPERLAPMNPGLMRYPSFGGEQQDALAGRRYRSFGG